MKRKTCPLCGFREYRVLFLRSFRVNKHLNKRIFSARRSPDRIHGTIVECMGCGLVRTLEVIDPSKLKTLYGKSLFTYGNLIENLRTSYAPILKKAASYLKQKKNFLEIGCGNGFLLEEAIKLGFSKVAGVEPSDDAIKKADKKIRKYIKNDILRPGLYPKESFDLVAAFQVFDHIPDPNSFLQTCNELLKPKGILVLMNHDVGAISAKILSERSPIYDIEHTYLYRKETIVKILEKNRFSVIQTSFPPTVFSIRYLSRLLPLPSFLKERISRSKNLFFDVRLKVYPGNICVYAQK